MLQTRELRLREVTCPRQSQGSYATESQHGQVRKGSFRALVMCLYPAYSVDSQVLLVWGCHPSTKLPLFSHLFKALTLSSTSVVMLPQTSRWLLTSPLLLPLENLYLVTHPSRWRWIHLKVIVKRDEKRFSKACAWRHCLHFCLLPQENDLMVGMSLEMEGKLANTRTMVLRYSVGIRALSSLRNHTATCHSAYRGANGMA